MESPTGPNLIDAINNAYEMLTGKVRIPTVPYEDSLETAGLHLQEASLKIESQRDERASELWEVAKQTMLLHTHKCPEGHVHHVFTQPGDIFPCTDWIDEDGTECGKLCFFVEYLTGGPKDYYMRRQYGLLEWYRQDPHYKILDETIEQLRKQKEVLSNQRYRHYRARQPDSKKYSGSEGLPNTIVISAQLWDDLNGQTSATENIPDMFQGIDVIKVQNER